MRLHYLAIVGIVCVSSGYPTMCGTQVVDSERMRQTARVRLQQGRVLLDAGQFEGAKEAFAAAVVNEQWLEPPERAAAHFGRGASIQEIFRAPDAPNVAATDVDTAIADYSTARQLDSIRYFVASHYNAALLLSTLGKHQPAAAYFINAAGAGPETNRRPVLLRAAREFDLAGDVDAASRTYRQLLATPIALAATDSVGIEARLALARRPLVVGGDSAAAWLGRLVNDSSLAPRVADAALAALNAMTPEQSRGADSLLLILAIADVNAHASIQYFAESQRNQLLLATKLPNIRDAIHAFIAAYDGREVPPPGGPALSQSPWWNASFERRHVWTQVLRTVGEWNESAGKHNLAAQYYEAALGYPNAEVAPWADLDAMLPLILMLDSLSTTSQRVARDLDNFLTFVFSGKAMAYERNEQPRIRQFHMALGSYYAKRRRWLGQPRGAIFQLEHMRAATERLSRADTTVYDPPLLVEQLMEGYLATNRAPAARNLLTALKSSNERSGRKDNSGQWRTRIDAAGRPP